MTQKCNSTGVISSDDILDDTHMSYDEYAADIISEMGGRFFYSENVEDIKNYYIPTVDQKAFFMADVVLDGKNIPLNSLSVFFGMTDAASVTSWVNTTARTLANTIDELSLNPLTEIHSLSIEIAYYNLPCDLSKIIIEDTSKLSEIDGCYNQNTDCLLDIINQLDDVFSITPYVSDQLASSGSPLAIFSSDVFSVMHLALEIDSNNGELATSDYIVHQVDDLFPVFATIS